MEILFHPENFITWAFLWVSTNYSNHHSSVIITIPYFLATFRYLTQHTFSSRFAKGYSGRRIPNLNTIFKMQIKFHTCFFKSFSPMPLYFNFSHTFYCIDFILNTKHTVLTISVFLTISQCALQVQVHLQQSWYCCL